MRDQNTCVLAVRILFAIGIVVSAAAMFIEPLPHVNLVIAVWLFIGFGGCSTGVVAWHAPVKGMIPLTILLVVSTSAILLQPYNWPWLQNFVFWFRVYVAHIGLAAGVLSVLFPRPETL